MKNVTTYVGIDTHKKDLFVAMLRGGEKTPVTWQLANEPKAVHRLVRKLERETPGPIRVFYEAGPCGYALQRQVTTSRVSCDVVAPALIPRKPGERVKTNRRDEAAYLEGLKAKATDARPQESTRDEARPRPSSPPSAVPIAVAADGRTLVPYLASEPTTETFRTFLQTHVELLRVAPTWTIRIVFPRPLDHAYDAYQAVIHEELESPLHSATIGELQSYFELRLEAARGEPMHPLNQGFLRNGHEVFTAMYHRWLKHRDAVFAGPSSPAIAEALNSGRGRVESVVLPHLYRHLAPLVADTPARPEPVNRGLRRGPTGENTPRHAINARPQPPPEEPQLSVREQCERDWHRLNEYYKAQKAQGVKP